MKFINLVYLVGVALSFPSFAAPEHAEGLKPLDAGMDVLHYQMRRNSTFYSALRELGLDPGEIHKIVSAASEHSDLSKIRAGTEFQLFYAKQPLGRLVEMEFELSPVKTLNLLREASGEWKSNFTELQSQLRLLSFSGRVTSSLWESAGYSGMDSSLIGELTDIFAWQIDFAREVRGGDRWRILVEQRHAGDKIVGWGRILSAEYEHGGQLYSAALLRGANGEDLGYYAPDGKSLRRMFLKAPMKFGRISSTFQLSRFHPILKISRPHLGVDYAAPIGTPVLAVGDGVVVQSGWLGGAGKAIRLRHNSQYQTAYKHLHGFAPSIHVGAKVRQGQVIGYVGTTGLSTGPHLHFELWDRGVYVDPLGRKFPSADPVPQKYLVGFQSASERWRTLLPVWVNADGEVPRGPVFVSSDSNLK
ncbi:MAG: peptidoglycan DD-metalloendopeptidase family protein [Bdellovibrionota bacterium]